jgi:hypothetical protein
VLVSKAERRRTKGDEEAEESLWMNKEDRRIEEK